MFQFKPLSTIDIILFIPVAAYVLKHVFRYLWYFPERCTTRKRLDDKIVLVTGGSSYGIGWALAREFARRGAKVILTGPNFDEAQVACNRIRCTTWSNNCYVNMQEMKLNLTSGQSIREFVKEFRKKNKKLHILVNCAGALPLDEKELTPEGGLEKTMAINYFGQFLLTNLLLDSLFEARAYTRIINVVDGDYKNLDCLDLDNLNSERRWEPKKVYARAKLCMVLFTKELNRRVKEWNEGKHDLDKLKLDVNCSNPGKTDTLLYRNKLKNKWFKIKYSIIKHFYRTPYQAAQSLLQLCVDIRISGTTGEYWEGCKQVQSTTITYDAKLAEKLWNKSVKVTELSPTENFFIDTPKPPPEEVEKQEEEKEVEEEEEEEEVEEKEKEGSEETSDEEPYDE